MNIFKNATVVELYATDSFQNAVDVSYAVDMDKFKREVQAQNIDEKIITDGIIEVVGSRLTPDVPDNKDTFLLEFDKNAYVMTFSFGKKSIPTGIIRKEIKAKEKKRVAELERALSEEEKADIRLHVEADVLSRAFMDYKDVVVVLDMRQGKSARIIINSTSKSAVKTILATLLTMPMKDGRELHTSDYLLNDMSFARELIFNAIINENSYDLVDVAFTHRDNEDLVRLSSSSDLMSDEDLTTQIKSNIQSDGEVKTYTYHIRGTDVNVELKGVIVSHYNAVGFKLKYLGEFVQTMDEDEADIFTSLKSDLLHDVKVVIDVIKDLTDMVTDNQQ